MRKYFAPLASALLLSLLSWEAFAANYRTKVDSPVQSLEIIQVDTDEHSTLVSMVYTLPSFEALYTTLFWVANNYANFDEKTVIRADSGKEFKLLSGINMPISSETEFRSMKFDRQGQRHQFLLEFEKLPDDVETFDIIEDEENPNGFNIYGIHLLKKEPVAAIDVNSFIKDYPVKEYGRYLKNGQYVHYYANNGIIVQMMLGYNASYGQYFYPAIDIQNLSGKSILFTPEKVSAYTFANVDEKSAKKRYRINDYLMGGGDGSRIIAEQLHVFTEKEYDKKIANVQAWTSALMGISQGLATASAGYSESRTTNSGSIYSDTNASAYASASAFGSDGSMVNAFGFASGSSHTFTRYYGTSTTTSYNASEAYMVRRAAAMDAAAYDAAQYQIRQSLTADYLKANTIQNEQDYASMCNIEFVEADHILIRIRLADVDYDFFF